MYSLLKEIHNYYIEFKSNITLFSKLEYLQITNSHDFCKWGSYYHHHLNNKDLF